MGESFVYVFSCGKGRAAWVNGFGRLLATDEGRWGLKNNVFAHTSVVGTTYLPAALRDGLALTELTVYRIVMIWNKKSVGGATRLRLNLLKTIKAKRE